MTFLYEMRSRSHPNKVSETWHFQQSAFSKWTSFFEAITLGYLRLSPLRSAYAFDTWAHLADSKKEVTIMN